jgi:Nucleotidyl transferase AbiEii toxin, Type IV TA system
MGSREIRNAKGVPHRARATPEERGPGDRHRPDAPAQARGLRAIPRQARTSESSGWLLKGAFALELRLGLRARTTKDIDLGRADDEEAATEHLEAATHVDLGDFFVFEARRTPLEQHVAEKLHAYTGAFGQDQRESTRVKDLVDLVLIGESADLDAKRLLQALATTFDQRARQQLPDAMSPPPLSWARPYAVLAREVGIAGDIEAGHAAVARLLDPVLRSEAGGHWDPEVQRWHSRT